MRRGRVLIFVLLIVIVGLVVAVFAIRLVTQSLAPKPQAPQYVKIYYAKQNIPQGGKITADVIDLMEIPQQNLTAVEYTEARQAELLNNKVAKFPLDQGVVITSSMVADASQAVSIAGPQWAALIPPGMTAVSIPTTRLSLVAYGINDGAHVNLNACFLFVDVDPGFQSATPNLTAIVRGTGIEKDTNIPVLSLSVASGGEGSAQGRLELDPSLQQPYYVIPSEPQRPRVVCQTILQDVIVMKLGNFPLTPTDQAAQQQSQQQQQQVVAPDIVTLIVSPQDAVTLSYMVYTDAKIMMTLRNPSDQSRLATEAATLQFLLSQYNIPVPAKLPYALQPRIDSLVAPTLPNDAPAPAQ